MKKIEDINWQVGNNSDGLFVKKNQNIKAKYKNVSSTQLCTTISNSSGVSVSTIEHLKCQCLKRSIFDICSKLLVIICS